MQRSANRITTITLAALVMAASTGLAHAATKAGDPAHVATSDRVMAKDADAQRDQLQAALNGLETPTAVTAKLNQLGFMVTAINDADKSYIEYEVVKGHNSHEVKMDLKANKVVKLDVAPNLWRAESTKQALEGKKVEALKTGDYSDSRFLPAFNSEKEALQKSMAPGKAPAAYLAQLKALGFNVTSVNDKDKDYVEVEVVKGTHSYEVQIDVDEKTGKAEKIDVTTNLWETEATEAALKRNGG